jgi:hypothetical protein
MPNRSKSDPTRFSFHIPGIPARFSVVEFSVTESISLPFQLDVKMNPGGLATLTTLSRFLHRFGLHPPEQHLSLG